MHHHLCNLNPNGIVYPPIKLIRPVLHHHFTLIKIGRLVVRAAYIICISMGQLRFNSIRSVSHFIQACAACGSCCMRAVCTTPVKALEKLTQRVRCHRAAWVISSRKEVLPMSCQTMEGSVHFNGLRGRGIRCSMRAFIRVAGRVHNALSRSNSAHSASVTSAGRASVHHISHMQ